MGDLLSSIRISRRNISKSLAKEYGGKWTYDNYTTWWCDDGIRHMSRVSADFDEWGNQVGHAQYYLYGDGTPRKLYF